MKLRKEDLVARINRLLSGDWNEEEMKTLFNEISENVPCPFADIQGFIFHAKDNPTPETMLERMLAYRPTGLPDAGPRE